MVVVNITGALAGNQFEPSIAVNTLNPNILCVVAVDTSTGPTLTGFYRSIDGGTTWSTSILPNPPGYAGAEAPTIDYTFPSTFIVTVHVFNGFNDGTIVSYTSFDDGLTWQPPVIVQAGYGTVIHNDEPLIAVDRSPGSPYRGNAYVGYTPLATTFSAIFSQRSLTQGLNWEAPDRQSSPRGTHDRAALAVGFNGEVYAGYIITGPASPSALLRISYDGGINYQPSIERQSTFIASVVPSPSPLPVPNYQFRVQTNLNLAADISNGPFSGTVYAVWNDARNGYTDVFLSESPDGLLWSDPVSITSAPVGTQNFFPSIAVSPYTGTIRVIYYSNQIDGFLLDVYVAESFNGGATFTNRRLTTTSFNPNGISPVPTVLIGDYITAQTTAPDNLAAVWMATTLPTGKLDVYFGT
ncbi:exo-alpha-sialidase [Paenibacillus sp. MER 99-2]|uniref:exo-alpha-sialidase n=1 Tax=Paenibacillus sp. MER 99-2 TaxID=2939572 RepID=UPI00203C29F4|nr:exo-alpha-sialidase [Paenibacillus sp. MER 99-2]MCM3172099.1 exo-alpha-sialidase [Paenibacillus sp. MER 99-2]